MKKLLNKTVAILSLFVMVLSMLAFVGCGDGGEPEKYTVTLSRRAIELDELSEPVTLTAMVVDSKGIAVQNPELTWTSGDLTVVTVNNGTITIVGAGEAVVVCAYGEFSSACVVTVNKYYEPEIKVVLANKEVQVPFVKNSTLNVVATILKDGEPLELTPNYSSSNTVVATVDESGKITVLAVGYTEITVSVSQNGYTSKAVLKLTVGEVQSEDEQKDVVTPDKDW